MKKKNKGFTLVELLATIVIIGILAAVSLPTILNLLSDNTKKVYVNDAIKLISQAEYKIRAASTNVQKPNDSGCIVMSLVFLNNSDFDNPPNKGEYLKEASYVVIKNNGGDLEYSATLVEKMKNGGFRGVKLTTSTELNGKNAKKYVVDFKKSDLVYVDTEELNAGYINNELGKNYVSQIDNKYNYPDLGETVVDEEMMAPHITKAGLSSASGKDYNSLDVQLSISAVDKDTPKSKLKVRYNVVLEGEEGSYPDPSSACSNSDDTVSGCFDWGSNNNFIKSLDFSKKLSYYDGKSSFTMYLIVIDDDGNYDKKQLTYKVHRNQAPVIEKFAVEKLPSDPGNMPTARVKLSVSDDVDDYGNLLVCLTEDTSCKDSDYKSYNSLFNENGYTNYKFMCDNGVCSPDGTTHYLKVFVKDSSGLVSSNMDSCKDKNSECGFKYIFYKNQPPKISTLESDSKLHSKYAKFMDMGEYYCGGVGKTCEAISGNTLDYYLTLKVTDELSDNNNIMLSIQEVDAPKNGKPVANTKSSNISYADFLNTYQYGGTFSGNYDGKPRYLKIVATDEYGEEDSITLTYEKVHMNQAPVLVTSDSKISSTGCPSKIASYCNSNVADTGNINTKIKLKIVDDLDNDSKIIVETYDKNYSGTKESNTYSKTGFSDGTKMFKFQTEDSSKPYAVDSNNGKRTYIVNMTDSYKAKSTSSLNYTIYQNKPPLISATSVSSAEESPIYDKNNIKYYLDGNSLSSIIKVNLIDDLDDDSQINVSIKDMLNNNISSSFKYSNIMNSGIKYTFSGKYDGVDRKYKVVASDSYGVSSESNETKYSNIYKNVAPTVEDLSVESVSNTPCKNTKLCTNEGGSLDTIVKFKVRDDLDSESNILYCVAVGDNKCTPNKKYSSSIFKDGIKLKVADKYPNEQQEAEPPDVFDDEDSNNDGSTASYGETQSDNSEVVVKVYLIDTYSESSNSLAYYHLYKNKAPIFDEDSVFISNSEHNQSIIKGSFSVEDDFDSNDLKWQFCYKDKNRKEHCFSPVQVTSSNDYLKNIEFTADLAIAPDEFKGQEYNLYVKVTDTNNLISTTLKTSYQVDVLAYPELTADTTTLAIGTTKYKYSNNLSQNFTDTVNNKTYLCSGYYKVYKISYKKVSLGDDDSNNYMIVRDKVQEIENNKYCAEAVDATDGPYLFNYGILTHESPYARYDDSNGGK